jgi:hypothetical protein
MTSASASASARRSGTPLGFVPLAALVGISILATHVRASLQLAAAAAEAAAGTAGPAAATLSAGLAGRGEPWQLALALASLAAALAAVALLCLPEAQVRRVLTVLDPSIHLAPKGTP